MDGCRALPSGVKAIPTVSNTHQQSEHAVAAHDKLFTGLARLHPTLEAYQLNPSKPQAFSRSRPSPASRREVRSAGCCGRRQLGPATQPYWDPRRGPCLRCPLHSPCSRRSHWPHCQGRASNARAESADSGGASSMDAPGRSPASLNVAHCRHTVFLVTPRPPMGWVSSRRERRCRSWP